MNIPRPYNLLILSLFIPIDIKVIDIIIVDYIRHLFAIFISPCPPPPLPPYLIFSEEALAEFLIFNPPGGKGSLIITISSSEIIWFPLF